MPTSSRRSKKPLKRRSRSRSGGAGASVEPPFNKHLMHWTKGEGLHNSGRFMSQNNQQNGALEERNNALSKMSESFSPAAKAYNAIIMKYWNEWSDLHFTSDAMIALNNTNGKNPVATCFFNSYNGAIHARRNLEEVFFECLDKPPPEGWNADHFGGKKGRKTRRARK